MAALTIRIHQPTVIAGEEMTSKTNLRIDRKVFVALEVTMTRPALDLDPVNLAIDVLCVSEFDAAEIDLRRNQLFGAVAPRPQTRIVGHTAVWLGPVPADDTVDRLGKAHDLALGIFDDARTQVTGKTIDLVVGGRLPAFIIRLHYMARIAEGRLTGHLDGNKAKQRHADNRCQNYPFKPAHGPYGLNYPQYYRFNMLHLFSSASCVIITASTLQLSSMSISTH
jgi:hypothetical protein